MKQLIESCRKAIEEQKCLGCQNLENENFVGNRNCIYSKTRTAEESINRIYKNLGVDKIARNYR